VLEKAVGQCLPDNAGGQASMSADPKSITGPDRGESPACRVTAVSKAIRTGRENPIQELIER
jgi:hypothetical protein